MNRETQPPDNKKELSPLQQSSFVIKKLKASLDSIQRQRTEPIAIIGASCRFPGGAVSMESYWRLLRDGVDAVREVPRERWDVDAFYDPDPAAPGKTSTRNAARSSLHARARPAGSRLRCQASTARPRLLIRRSR